MTCVVQITHARACWGTGRPLPASDGVHGPWHVGRAARVGWGVPVERPKPKARGLGTMMHCREVLVAHHSILVHGVPVEGR